MSASGILASVEIYPRSGGSIVFRSQNILQISTKNNIRSGEETFSIFLAPGGPNGMLGPSWAEVITPMSLCIIAMQRGKYSNVVMVGLVTQTNESQSWDTGKDVIRYSQINGQGFTYYFNTTSYYALTSMTGFADIFANLGIAINSSATLPALSLSATGTPTEVAKEWFTSPMGANKGTFAGVLNPINIFYQNNNIPLYKCLQSVFIDDPNLSIPLPAFLFGQDGTWDSKFRQILEWPFYEYFVTTAPLGFYDQLGPLMASDVGIGSPFYSLGLPNAYPATPTLVCRFNPWPRLVFNGTEFNPTYSSTPDNSAWESLQVFSPQYGGFIASNVGFSPGDVRNVFFINSNFAQTINSQLGNSSYPQIIEAAYGFNVDSLSRYGYWPEIHYTNYFANLTKSAMLEENAFLSFNSLTLNLATWYGPVPQLSYGNVTMELRPDIFPGTRFRYAPFRDGLTWEFYILGVEHTFDFGTQRSITTLELERGMPESIYSGGSVVPGLQANQTDLYQILIGAGTRVDGVYQTTQNPVGGFLTLRNFKENNTIMNLFKNWVSGYNANLSGQ